MNYWWQLCLNASSTNHRKYSAIWIVSVGKMIGDSLFAPPLLWLSKYIIMKEHNKIKTKHKLRLFLAWKWPETFLVVVHSPKLFTIIPNKLSWVEVMNLFEGNFDWNHCPQFRVVSLEMIARTVSNCYKFHLKKLGTNTVN